MTRAARICAARLAAKALQARGRVGFAALLIAIPALGQTPSQTVNLAPGTRVELAVVRPVWAKTAKPGDPLYMQVDFPVLSGQNLAIPAGSWVQGIIESIDPPTRRKSRAEIEVLFTDIIFANGYALQLPQVWPPAQAAVHGGPQPTASQLTLQVSTANDLLLDNGAQLEMTLAMPVAIDASAIAASVPLTKPPAPGSFRSATLCRPTPGSPGSPGTPGTPDTVIPGSPGTPDTVIPGGPGMPDTVIPGTPATPDTVIPGTPGTPDTPGTPGTSCPTAPIVLSSAPIVNPSPLSAGSATAH